MWEMRDKLLPLSISPSSPAQSDPKEERPVQMIAAYDPLIGQFSLMNG